MSDLPLHPLLFAAYPVLALLAANLGEVEPWVALRPLAVSLLAAGLLLVLARPLLRSWARAALAVTILLALFFSYGHVYNLLETSPAGPLLGRHRVLAPLYGLLLAGGLWWAVRRAQPRSLTLLLNAAAAALVLISAGQVAWSSLRTARPAQTVSVESGGLSLQTADRPPDIYYIILDMYARGDVLQRQYGFDNQPFLQELEQLGFTVARCSRSNYPGTELSLASSLNMDYLDRFAPSFAPGSQGESLLPGLIKDGRVRRSLEGLGYRAAAFETGYYWSQWMDAPLYLAPTRSGTLLAGLRPFEALLLKSSAAVLAVDASARLLERQSTGLDFLYNDHIQRQRFVLEKLPSLASIAGPKLVFAHILIPHNPQVFAADGSINADPAFWSNGDRAANEDYFRRGYTGQVAFVNSQVLGIVRSLIAQSSTPPVIILQGDHGVGEPDRQAILNAYYLPGADPAVISQSISPVNTFRVVFNTYFGANLPLLPDQGYQLDAQGGWEETSAPCPLP